LSNALILLYKQDQTLLKANVNLIVKMAVSARMENVDADLCSMVTPANTKVDPQEQCKEFYLFL
jgi:hypothetical protein